MSFYLEAFFQLPRIASLHQLIELRDSEPARFVLGQWIGLLSDGADRCMFIGASQKSIVLPDYYSLSIVRET